MVTVKLNMGMFIEGRTENLFKSSGEQLVQRDVLYHVLKWNADRRGGRAEVE